MKVRYGFTLIEIIAVITILGIILIIALPTVITLINNTKEDVFIVNEKILSISAENYYNVNATLLPKTISEIKVISIDSLINLGYIPIIKNPNTPSIICNGYVVVEKITSNKYNYKAYLDCGEGLITEGYNDYLHLVE